MVDLDALSREIAATSDAWMQRGVSGVTPDGRVWLWTGGAWIDDCYMPASEDEGGSEVAGIWPHLHSPVTRNALLDDRRVSERRTCEGIGDYYWCGPTDAKGNGEIGPDVITAICRAWIAAHKGEK